MHLPIEQRTARITGLDDAIAALNRAARISGKTIVRVRP
jgi:hypothetical protein